jgi:hypothetical protein
MNRAAERLTAFLSGGAVPVGDFDASGWDRVVELARRNGVAQVLPACWKARGTVPPPAVSERVQAIRLVSAARNIRLFHELEIIFGAFKAAGIPVVPLKGAWLAESVYADIGQRTMGDVDLWVERKELEAARRVMESLGYSSRSKADRPQELQDALTGETQLFKPNATMVELHWNVFPGEWLRHTARIDENAVWERTLPFKGEGVRRLSPEDGILHLCVHLAVNHQMSSAGLRTLLDLDRIRQRWSIDWGTVARRALEGRISNATWLVLRMLEEVFGDPEKRLPLRELSPSPLRRRILRRFISPRDMIEDACIISGPKRFLFLLALVDRPAAAFHLMWRAFVPDRTWLTLRYGLKDAPGWRIGLQRLWHPFRVCLRRDV